MRAPERLRERGVAWLGNQALLVVPLAFVAALTAADILASSQVHLGPLLIVAPALTASFAGPRLTALIGVVAVGCQVLIAVDQRQLGTMTLQSQIVALAVVTVLVVLFCYVRDRERRELLQVRSVAEAAQRALMRPLPNLLGPLRLSSVYVAAEAEAKIGGDLYGALRTGDKTRLIIGDARGKGLAAVSDAALLLGAFREAARRARSLGELTAYLMESVGMGLHEPTADDQESGERFVTAAIVDVPDDGRTLRLISCGHPPPLRVRRGVVTPLRTAHPVLPLGLGDISEPEYVVETFPFEVGDVLVLYTDGLIEARDADGNFYPPAERIAAWGSVDADTLLTKLHQDLLAHVGGHLGDDVAMVAVERLPDPGDDARGPAASGQAG